MDFFCPPHMTAKLSLRTVFDDTKFELISFPDAVFKQTHDVKYIILIHYF